MNLIEQLGGYEKAKRALDREIRLTSPNTFYCLKLNDALLDYRRQHNIFEVGDLCKISTKHDYGLYKFLRMRDDRIYLEDRLGFAEFGIHKDVVDHATDAEIKAGKRLGVDSE